MFKVLKIKEGNVKSTRRILFITETNLEKSDGASVNDRKTINCLKKFGKLKCFYLKDAESQPFLKKYYIIREHHLSRLHCTTELYDCQRTVELFSPIY